MQAAKNEAVVEEAAAAAAAAAAEAAAVPSTATGRPAKRAKATKAAPSRRRGIYLLDKIVDWRWNITQKRLEYEVRWLGYAEKDTTWEPKENITAVNTIALDELMKWVELTRTAFQR